MSIFTITNNVAQLTASQTGTDNFIGGIRFSATGAAVANSIYAAGGTWVNGLQINPTGYLCVYNATGGLPATKTTSNGLIFDGNGCVCSSTNAMVSYCNGLPLDANGALCVNLIP